MLKLLNFNSLAHASAWLAEQTGDSSLSAEYLLELCRIGELEILAAVPDWITHGQGEVDWRIIDHTTGELKPVTSVSGDGFISISQEMATRIQNHGRASLDSARMPVINVTPAGMMPSEQTLRGMHDGRMIDISHLRVRRAVLEAFATRASEKTIVTKSMPSTPERNDADATQMTWQEKAREIADRLESRDSASELHDSVKNISERVSVELRKLVIHGPRGPLSAGTVLREALQGGRWKRRG